MNEETPKSFSLLNWLVSIAVILLITTGIYLIKESYNLYKESVEFSDKAMSPSSGKNPLIVAPGFSIIKEGYGQALMFFTLGLGGLLLLLLLPRLQNLSIGPAGITLALKEVKQNIEAVIKQNNSLQANSTGEGGSTKNLAAVAPKEELEGFDPQKGKWGGLSEANSRLMTAKVTPSTISGFYQVKITVVSTNEEKPLKGDVRFYLHPTFSNSSPVITVVDGKATLLLSKVYGAFTLGAELDKGDTKLELDLAELKNAPKDFLEK
jgi:hypothetical protein